jgi:hypothetical protein
MTFFRLSDMGMRYTLLGSILQEMVLSNVIPKLQKGESLLMGRAPPLKVAVPTSTAEEISRWPGICAHCIGSGCR